MTKILFKPFSMFASRLAGRTSRKLVDRIWGAAAPGERPKAEESAASWGRLAGALLLEGAIFRAVGGLADHAARRWFAHLTGRWPGEKRGTEPGSAPDAES
ncbi:MAG TPA: DUF4235 domain-containing protein [Solirubrobacteraceae bacterium]|jgi:hypothetical protein